MRKRRALPFSPKISGGSRGKMDRAGRRISGLDRWAGILYHGGRGTRRWRDTPNNGNRFRHALAEYIRGWGDGLEVAEEKYIGWRFIGTPRKLDVVVMNPVNCRSMAIEAKLQETSGSAFEKLSYALDDCIAAPIPSIIVFSGKYIRDDMKAKLISSGCGIEVGFQDGMVEDRHLLLKQRVYIELGMNYFHFLRP